MWPTECPSCEASRCGHSPRWRPTPWPNSGCGDASHARQTRCRCPCTRCLACRLPLLELPRHTHREPASAGQPAQSQVQIPAQTRARRACSPAASVSMCADDVIAAAQLDRGSLARWPTVPAVRGRRDGKQYCQRCSLLHAAKVASMLLWSVRRDLIRAQIRPYLSEPFEGFTVEKGWRRLSSMKSRCRSAGCRCCCSAARRRLPPQMARPS